MQRHWAVHNAELLTQSTAIYAVDGSSTSERNARENRVDG